MAGNQKEPFFPLVLQYERLVYTICFQLGRIAANKAKDRLQSAWNRRAVMPGDENLPPGLSPPAEEIALQHSSAGSAPLRLVWH